MKLTERKILWIATVSVLLGLLVFKLDVISHQAVINRSVASFEHRVQALETGAPKRAAMPAKPIRAEPISEAPLEPELLGFVQDACEKKQCACASRFGHNRKRKRF